ncbi:hypothetical protein GGQ73_000341 [Rhizobium skierniewicense]|uniref:Uncharacterized protein n=1 Tax=Rhizobium skierniewicense TaxID=984260 RepID=A0A7W6G020_9HYPH|nr:hypothetical protein [Rhizobium skierniewicense]MBB3944418.1 hypothetical protein [Rhizobium skierniewicense]
MALKFAVIVDVALKAARSASPEPNDDQTVLRPSRIVKRAAPDYP